MKLTIIDLMTNTEYPILKDCREVMIGNSPSNDIAIPDLGAAFCLKGVEGLAKRTVNGIHCTLYKTRHGFELIKYDKKVYVSRGEKQQEIPMDGLVLEHGDKIVLGGAYSLEVEIEADSPETLEVLE